MIERTGRSSFDVISSRLRRSLWQDEGVGSDPEAPMMDVAVITGSGLSHVSSAMDEYVRIPYADLPGFPVSGVAGHAGELRLGKIGHCNVVFFAGRVHMYEGYTPYELCHPVRLAAELGAHTLIVTNAAGGLDESLNPGDLMLLTDQINMTGVSSIDFPESVKAGLSPFVDMSDAYNAELRELAAYYIEHITGFPAHRGVYVGVGGPNYETPAEVAMYRAIGGSAIGMSTVLEVIAARQLGMNVLGVSCITNSLVSGEEVTHEEVLEAGERAAAPLTQLITEVVQQICHHPNGS